MANIELDGGNKKITVDSGDLTLDIPGDIILDADGADLVFADGGTNILKITNSSSDVVLQPQVDAKDIIFKQYDGTTVATVEDNATFNIPTGKLAINGTAITSTAAEINLIDGGTARGTTAIADGDGVLINDAGTMRMTNVTTLKTYIGGGWTSATAQSPTSGTSFSFTSLPAGLSVIHVCLADLSCNGSGENFLLEIGDSGGFETSGYLATVTHLQAGAGQGGTNSTAAFLIAQGPGASDVVGGVLTLVHLGSNLWSMGGVIKTSASYTNHTGGTKTLSAELDRINIKTSGTNTFDAGTVNLIYA